MSTRRHFLGQSALAAACTAQEVLAPAAQAATSAAEQFSPTQRVSMNGIWQFRFDPHDSGESQNWQTVTGNSQGWTEVSVPHTWQISPASTGYFGTAWYRRVFNCPAEWGTKTVRIEFEAVFHSTRVWVNGAEAGQHLRKGYTAFVFDITPRLRLGAENVVVVKVNNAYDDHMLPRGRSFDWTNDGGIYRPVVLLVTPKVYIERVAVETVPDLANKTAELQVTVAIRNSGASAFRGEIACHAVNQSTGLEMKQEAGTQRVAVPARTTTTIGLPATRISNVSFWHFDAPTLYSLQAELSGRESNHRFATKFGIRHIEVKNASFYLNGERVRLMGVERMAGSDPQFGMAEPSLWIDHDHADLKKLNCVFTRAHWPQDTRVLDYCDEHGILIQTEVPCWGADTFKGMGEEPAPGILQNGLEQLQEMIARDRNHPCIFSWGLCNEVNGQNPAAYRFAQRLLAEAKKLNPGRLCSYASNSLQKTPERDLSGLMDFIEWNEYYETWYPGTPADVRRNLQEIHRAFPDKPIVISEYGYCACTADRPEGDHRRVEILRAHTAVCRETEYVGGLIFFCYNDYRTHIGDEGLGVMKQRIHGVVDLLGTRKSSYAVLREESGPVEALEWQGSPASFVIKIRTRKSVPAYTLAGYTLRGTLYGYSDIPLEEQEALLPSLTPGQSVSIPLSFKQGNAVRVEFDVVRPTGFSALMKVWRP